MVTNNRINKKVLLKHISHMLTKVFPVITFFDISYVGEAFELNV
jgi:hypothetical protein